VIIYDRMSEMPMHPLWIVTCFQWDILGLSSFWGH